MSANSAQIYPRPALLIIVLSIAPAIGLGICRFAYALVLGNARERGPDDPPATGPKFLQQNRRDEARDQDAGRGPIS